MDIVFNRFASCFGRCLEQRTHVDVETAIGISRSYHFGAAVVSVLPHLRNHDARLTALFLGKLSGQLASPFEVCIFLRF